MSISTWWKGLSEEKSDTTVRTEGMFKLKVAITHTHTKELKHKNLEVKGAGGRNETSLVCTYE
jgi:hypothetical protein